MKSLEQLCEEHVMWVTRNFGAPSISRCAQPALGITEEFGELSEALGEERIEAIRDACADALIFSMDLCACLGLNFTESFVDGVSRRHEIEGSVDAHVLELLGKLSHHTLKTVQGIRHEENHKERLSRVVLPELFYVLQSIAASYEFDLQQALVDTWDKIVSKRDWRQDEV